MTQTGTTLTSPPLAQTPTLSIVLSARMYCALIILLGSFISLLGTNWDIQWHSFIGRDRTLIPPHLMMLSGVTLSGLAALAAICSETFLVRRNPTLKQYTTDFAGLFSGSLGAYIAGFGALDAAIAFPLDSYWHALYGVDVAIWAPFHVMLLIGGGLIPLGVSFMFLSIAHLTERADEIAHHRRIGRAYFWTSVAQAHVLGIFTILISDGLADIGGFQFGDQIVNLFPVFSALLVGGVLISSRYALPQPRAATRVALIYLAFIPILSIFVPPATNLLVTFEHLRPKEDLGIFGWLSIMAIRFWPLAPIIVALLLDRFSKRSQDQHWSARKLLSRYVLTTCIACFPIVIIFPPLFLLAFFQFGILGGPLSLALGIVGAFGGVWIGLHLGIALREIAR